MQTSQTGYFAAYRNLTLTRDGNGVLVAEFHSNGEPFIMSAQAHTEFVDAFYRIAQDRANKIVILTGAGGEFITDVDWSSFGDVADPGVWSQVHDEGVQVLENIANIRVPVIAAIEGRAHVHSDYALLASVIVAAEGATFHDVAHFAAGVAPGDGIFTTWSYRAGAGRAEAFLLNPQPLAARTAYEWGVVAELVSNGKALGRARELSELDPEGSGSDAPQHARAFHSTVEGAHRAGGRLRTIARRSVIGRPGKVKAIEELGLSDQNRWIEALPDGSLRLGALAGMSDVAANAEVRRQFPVVVESLQSCELKSSARRAAWRQDVRPLLIGGAENEQS